MEKQNALCNQLTFNSYCDELLFMTNKTHKLRHSN